MSMETICRAIRWRWYAFAQLVWPDSPQQRTQTEIDRLTTELARRYQRLVRRRCQIEQMRDRLTRQQRRIDDLTDQVQQSSDGPRGWELVLLLDRLHRAINRNRERLHRYEQAYANQRMLFEHRKQIRQGLMRGQIVLAAVGDA